MSTSDAAAREYRHLSTVLAKEDAGLSDLERLGAARRLTELAPTQADSWWSVATQITWMLRDLEGEPLRVHPQFSELIAAWDHAIAIDATDAAAPYNKAGVLSRAGLRSEAYDSLMAAGRTELAHPSSDVDWPAHWHFEDAAELALENDDTELARLAAQSAIDAGARDDDAASLLERIRGEHGSLA